METPLQADAFRRELAERVKQQTVERQRGGAIIQPRWFVLREPGCLGTRPPSAAGQDALRFRRASALHAKICHMIYLARLLHGVALHNLWSCWLCLRFHCLRLAGSQGTTGWLARRGHGTQCPSCSHRNTRKVQVQPCVQTLQHVDS